MTLHKTRNPHDRLFATQLSRIDWGDLKSSFAASFTRGNSGGADATPANSMAAAAAAVASSYGDGISGELDIDDVFVLVRSCHVQTGIERN